jgi:23S rRNA (pseudouridine1915-N3)-methyltransferase
MQIKIYCFGKVKNKNILSEIEELSKRIPRIEIIQLKEVKDKNIDIIKQKEFKVASKYIDKSCFNVLLWEFGDEFSTKKFYDKLSKVDRDICFFVTGPYGHSLEFRDNIDLALSLSKMTFTHEQALYLLVEQLYRVHCFDKNIPYTK